MIRTVCRSAYSYRYSLPVLLFGVLVSVMPACIVVVDNDDLFRDDYYRRRWRLEVIVYGSTSYYPSLGSNYTLSLDAENTATGRADCVDFEGRYEVGRSSTMHIQGLQTVGAGCGGESLASMYIDGLNQAQTYSGNRDRLVIRFSGENNELRFLPY